MIAHFDAKYTDGVISLWNEVAVRDGYCEMDRRRFVSVFTGNPYFRAENTFVMAEEDAVYGFACGCTGDDLPLGADTGYITCILLADPARSDGNFSLLLGRLEESFRRQGKKQADVLFFNPMMLPWYIPGTPGHLHNNAPGAMTESFFHLSLLRNGYRERARECAMYLNLSRFSIPPAIDEKERAAARAGYEVAPFDPARHSGVEPMLRTLGNPVWRQEITRCMQTGVPVLVAAKGGETVGFAGPVVREESGRGYFTGIGVVPAHEGKGLGSVLFFRLCRALRDVGADYMSLFTGVINPAIRIYRSAGFMPVREFAVLRREFTEHRSGRPGSSQEA